MPHTYTFKTVAGGRPEFNTADGAIHSGPARSIDRLGSQIVFSAMGYTVPINIGIDTLVIDATDTEGVSTTYATDTTATLAEIHRALNAIYNEDYITL